ncbi:MAG: COX15/CtaA family protein [Gemmatimonadetes bacterium]|nr:COX15/CtaA family protein [Gemmatimonadota bacterium]
MKAIRTLAFVTAGFAYALIVLGAVVRITESGMGCGPDWPLCNGRLIPSFDDYHTVIEYFHRLAALGLIALAVALAGIAVAHRRAPGVSGAGGPFRAAVLAVVLLAVQVMLGAITVWLDLHASAVLLHLGTAMALLAALIVAGLRAGDDQRRSETIGDDRGRSKASERFSRGAMAAAALAALALLLGGLTATTGASTACQGFPLCNGQIWPSSGGGGLAHLHWTHRLLAYALFLHVIGLAMRARRAGVPSSVTVWTWASAALVTLQVIVAATMVLTQLPSFWRALHAAVGTAVWVTLVVLMWYARAPWRSA